MSRDRPKTVLILDDSEVVLELAASHLREAGFEVLTAADLGTFEAHQERGDFDLVLLDVQMPEMFGDDIGAVLRGVRGVEAPIYLFSSVDTSELSERAREAEVDGFISKNDGMDAMVQRVRAILQAP